MEQIIEPEKIEKALKLILEQGYGLANDSGDRITEPVAKINKVRILLNPRKGTANIHAILNLKETYVSKGKWCLLYYKGRKNRDGKATCERLKKELENLCGVEIVITTIDDFYLNYPNLR